jgi:formate dehydrogenase subunit gamma
MSAYEPWDAGRGAEIIAEHSHLEGATLVILHALQEAFGYVPEPAVPMVAEALNLSRAEVHGVFTFYHDFLCATAPSAMLDGRLVGRLDEARIDALIAEAQR